MSLGLCDENKKRWTRLVEARTMRGLTQRQVAALIGVEQGNFCEYEAGRRTPNADKVRKLAVALKVPTYFLFGLEWAGEVGVDGIPLSDAEVALVRAYRGSGRAARGAFDRLAAAAAPRA